jgi:xylan 1,4-beta-xylosidase
VREVAGNPRAAWNELGRPLSPSTRQLEVLREVAEPDRRHYQLPVVRGRVDLSLTLTRNEVTLMELTTVQDESPPWLNDRWILGAPAEPAP